MRWTSSSNTFCNLRDNSPAFSSTSSFWSAVSQKFCKNLLLHFGIYLSTSESFSAFQEKLCSPLCKLVSHNYHNLWNLCVLLPSKVHDMSKHLRVAFAAMWSFPRRIKNLLVHSSAGRTFKVVCVLISASLGHREQSCNHCYAQLIGPLGTKGWEIQDQINKQKHRIPMTYPHAGWNFPFFILVHRRACLSGWFIRALQEGSINPLAQSHTYLCASW